MNQTTIHNQCTLIPKYMIRCYPKVHTNDQSERFLGKDDLSHKMRGMCAPRWRFLAYVILLEQNLKSPC